MRVAFSRIKHVQSECGGVIKPDVVLYGECLNDETVEGAVRAIREADLLIVGGTSLVVYPAAGLINYYRGDRLVLINLQPTSADRMANLTMLYRLTPALIEEGYVYIAESPLYEITCKDDTWFAYSNREKEDLLAGELAGKKCSIQRSKGLGENEPDMMWLTTMNPATRRLIKRAVSTALI